MALTRVIAETILVKRLGPMMGVAEMAITIVGTNADLDDPLAWATRGVDGSTAAHNTVTDAELASVASTKYDDLMALAEWRTLKNIQGAINAVDITTGPRSERLHQFVEQVQVMLDRLEPTIEALGVLTTAMAAGYITLDFSEHGEDRL